MTGRQPQPHHPGQDKHGHCRQPVHRPPAQPRSDRSAESPRQQHAEENARHHDAHHATPLRRGRQMRGERHHDMHIGRERADQKRRRAQAERIGRQRHQRQRDDVADHQRQDQCAALELVPSGTKNSMPSAVPTWLSIASAPARSTVRWKSWAITSSNGWM